VIGLICRKLAGLLAAFDVRGRVPFAPAARTLVAVLLVKPSSLHLEDG
jgi:hypothetical protein